MTNAIQALTLYYQDNQTFPTSFCNDPQCSITPDDCECRQGRPQQRSNLGTGILGELVPNYISQQLRDPLHPKGNYLYQKHITGDAEYMAGPTFCNAPGKTNIAEMFYHPENPRPDDFFRSCPDGRPVDAHPWNGTKDDKNGWIRGFDIFNGEYASIGDGYK